MRLIDGDALLANVKRAVYTDDLSTTIAVGICEEHIRAMPTIDAAPVKHGRWELVDEAEPRRYGCSNCSCLSWYGTYKYCPNCGAKMDLDG